VHAQVAGRAGNRLNGKMGRRSPAKNREFRSKIGLKNRIFSGGSVLKNTKKRRKKNFFAFFG
jgi:hypothetical protein